MLEKERIKYAELKDENKECGAEYNLIGRGCRNDYGNCWECPIVLC